jgi:hypothetical protein
MPASTSAIASLYVLYPSFRPELLRTATLLLAIVYHHAGSPRHRLVIFRDTLQQEVASTVNKKGRFRPTDRDIAILLHFADQLKMMGRTAGTF